jgi:WXG100 family type VII secretion target
MSQASMSQPFWGGPGPQIPGASWSDGSGDVSGARIAVPSELQAAGTTINGIATAIEGELSALKSLLAPLQDTWTGAAQVYYQGLQNEWNIAADGLFGPTGVLGQIAQTMNLNWNNYTDSESANVRTWQH